MPTHDVIVTSATATPHEPLFELGMRATDYDPSLLAHLEQDGGGDTSAGRIAAAGVRGRVHHPATRPWGRGSRSA